MSDSTELARSTPDVATLIQFAIEKQCSSETMQGLYDLAKRAKEDAAKEAFDVAFTNFQALCPPIIKEKKAPKNMYASLENIKLVIQPFLTQCDLSYSFNAKFEGNVVTVICKVRHIAGHCEQSEFAAPIADVIRNSSGNAATNGMQMTAGAHTYAKRYALTDALGLTIAGEDTDGNPPAAREGGPVAQPRNDRVSKEELSDLHGYWKETMDALGGDQSTDAFRKFIVDNGGPSESPNQAGRWTREQLTSVGRAVDSLRGVN